MERYLAIVQNGKVNAIIVVDPDDIATIEHFGGLLLPEGSQVSVGWSYDGINFTAPPVPPSLPSSPSSFEVLQQALIDKGIISMTDIMTAAAKL